MGTLWQPIFCTQLLYAAPATHLVLRAFVHMYSPLMEYIAFFLTSSVGKAL